MTAPGNPLLMTDAQGRSYQLHVTSDGDDYFAASLMDGRTYVGYVRCLLASAGEMALCDLTIFAEALDHRNFLQRCWDRLLGQYPRTKNYQRRGLGTLLLRLVMEEASRRRVRRITGVIVESDLSRNPHLVRWYIKHGFAIGTPVPQDLAGAVYRIERTLGG